jgi:cbb3-type cytochrome oxidase maturation protein
MEIMMFLLPLAIILALIFIAAFIWMTLRGQYDDLDTPPYRMLIDDLIISKKKDKKDENK